MISSFVQLSVVVALLALLVTVHNLRSSNEEQHKEYLQMVTQFDLSQAQLGASQEKDVEILELRDLLSSEQQKFAGVQGEKESLAAEIDNYLSQISELSASAESAQAQASRLAEVEGALSQAQYDVQFKQEQLGEKEQQLASSEQTLSQLRQEVEELKNKVQPTN